MFHFAVLSFDIALPYHSTVSLFYTTCLYVYCSFKDDRLVKDLASLGYGVRYICTYSQVHMHLLSSTYAPVVQYICTSSEVNGKSALKRICGFVNVVL